MAVIDWDAWRHEYGSMTFADQQRFYADGYRVVGPNLWRLT